MTWSEVDLTGTQSWIIPAARMKAARDHRVPLTQAMIDLLTHIEHHPQSDLVFCNNKGKALSDMTLSATMKRLHASDLSEGGSGFTDERNGKPAVPHGLRSTFRDWAAEQGYERDMAELQLAHSVGSDVERAYRRSDMLERRRAMLEAWQRFLEGEASERVVMLGVRR